MNRWTGLLMWIAGMWIVIHHIFIQPFHWTVLLLAVLLLVMGKDRIQGYAFGEYNR